MVEGEDGRSMEQLSHPEYEQTFVRVANILERLAEHTDRLVERADQTSEQIGMLMQMTAAFREDLRETKELFSLRGAETTEKLNALIDLMDRPRQEPPPVSPQGDHGATRASPPPWTESATSPTGLRR
jgi:hypothetical protein